MNILELARLTEDEAREFIESIRWPNGPVCPHCAVVDDATKLKGGSHRPGLYKCNACRRQFTVTVNTIMHRSKVPMLKWLMAFHLMCSSKKGISALQLQRELGLGGYQTAWHMCHRIRYAMKEGGLAAPLASDVEVDETYIGGKTRKGAAVRGEIGRGTRKQPVVALVERGGRAGARVVADVSGRTLKAEIRRGVHRRSRIVTDEWGGYRGIGPEFDGGHLTVNYGRGECVRGDASTSTAESFFALLKRGIMGAFHHVSRRHRWRYTDEFAFRWNHRKSDARMVMAIACSGEKRLTYKPVVGLS